MTKELTDLYRRAIQSTTDGCLGYEDIKGLVSGFGGVEPTDEQMQGIMQVSADVYVYMCMCVCVYMCMPLLHFSCLGGWGVIGQRVAHYKASHSWSCSIILSILSTLP